MAPVIPLSAAQEAARLQALRPYKGLAAVHNPIFDQVALLTARLFAVPLAQLSLVDADEVIYAGNIGNPPLAGRLQRADSICAVAVYRPNAPTVFANLRAAPCPWVSEAAQRDFTFYASYPVQTPGGQPIGSLCVLDREPHEFGPGQQLILKRMAGIAMCLLDLQLLASPREAPAIWTALADRVELSLQRIATLTALARWEESAHTPAALAYHTSLHDERLLIVQDIEYQVGASFGRLGHKR